MACACVRLDRLIRRSGCAGRDPAHCPGRPAEAGRSEDRRTRGESRRYRRTTRRLQQCPASLEPGDTPGPRYVGFADSDIARHSVPQILLSRQLMREAGRRVGDLVDGRGRADGAAPRSFASPASTSRRPIPRKFSAQRLEARLHLPDLIALAEDPADPASADVVSAINLALVDRKDADARGRRDRAARARTRESRPPSRPTSPNDPFAVLDRFHWAIAIVTVTGSTAFLLALMVMRAEERRDIIGILRLMGVPSRSILLEVLLEGLLIAIARRRLRDRRGRRGAGRRSTASSSGATTRRWCSCA